MTLKDWGYRAKRKKPRLTYVNAATLPRFDPQQDFSTEQDEKGFNGSIQRTLTYFLRGRIVV